MNRTGNDSSPEDLRKVLRTHLPAAPSCALFGLTMEQQIAQQVELLKEMILMSRHPSASWIGAACKQVRQKMDAEVAARFAKVMAVCSQHCFQTARGTSVAPACDESWQQKLRLAERRSNLSHKSHQYHRSYRVHKDRMLGSKRKRFAWHTGQNIENNMAYQLPKHLLTGCCPLWSAITNQ